MADLAKQVYVDIDNDGSTNEGDQLGMSTYLAMSSTDGFVYGTDIPFTERDENGFITLTLMSDDAVTFAEKLPAFFAQPGTFWKNVTSDAHNQQIFMSGQALFLGNASLQDAKNLRDMKEDFGFLPYPKFDEEQTAYRSLVHDAVLLGGISGACQNLDMVGAVIEALNAETYRSVTPAWYETALKVKYSRDDISAQMIDLIHDSSSTNFIYAYNYALNGAGLLYRDLCTNNKTDYASAVKRVEKSAVKNLDNIIEIFSGSLEN